MTAMQGEIHGRWTKKCRPFQHTLVDWLCNTKIDYIMQLLCAVLAECFYTGASITFKAIKFNTIHILQHLLGPFPSIHSSSFAGVLVTSHSAGRNMAVGWIFSMYKLPSMQCFSFWSHFVSQLEEGALQTNFDLTSSPFPAWGWSNSTGPCPGSSVGRRCHHDQAVGACQGGRLKKQTQKHQNSKKLL